MISESFVVKQTFGTNLKTVYLSSASVNSVHLFWRHSTEGITEFTLDTAQLG